MRNGTGSADHKRAAVPSSKRAQSKESSETIEPLSLKTEDRSESIALPTSLERDGVRPGAVHSGGSLIPQEEIGAVDASASNDCESEADPAARFQVDEAHLISASLVEEGDNHTLNPPSSPMIVKGEVVGWAPTKCQFRTLLVLLVLAIGIATGLAVGLNRDENGNRKSDEAQQSPNGDPGDNGAGDTVDDSNCLPGLFWVDGRCHRFGDERRITVTHFATWGTKQLQGEYCIEGPPSAFLLCDDDQSEDAIRLIAANGATCEKGSWIDEETTEKIFFIGCEPSNSTKSVPIVLFSCQAPRVEGDLVRAHVELSDEIVSTSDICSKSERDVSFVSIGPLCRSPDSSDKRLSPTTGGVCDSGNEESISVGGKLLDFCVDYHEDEAIILEATSDYPDSPRGNGILENCLVSPNPPFPQVGGIRDEIDDFVHELLRKNRG